MDQVENITQEQEPVKRQSAKVLPFASAKRGRKRKSDVVMAPKTENEDLNLHVSLCEQRYKELEGRLDVLDQKIRKVEDQIHDLKTSVSNGFNEIRLLIEKQNNARTIQLIATFGTITVAVVGLLGYIITH